MLNNAQPLKSVLAQKVAQQDVRQGPMPTEVILPPNCTPSPDTPVLSLVLTLSLPFGDALPQLERIQQLLQALGLQEKVQSRVSQTQDNARKQSVQAQKSCLSGPLPSNKPPVASVQPLPMTDRQKRMIFALVGKKRLSDAAVCEVLEQEFGHQDGARLTKSEASKLIDRLMAK